MIALRLNSFTDRDNLVGIAWHYVRTLRVPVTLTTLREKLSSHPDYPSLLSLADVCDQLKVENAALRIDTDQLSLLETPYIAHIHAQGGMFVEVTKANETHIHYSTHKGEQKSDSREEFLKKWSGVVFIAEPTPESGEKDYLKKRQAEQLENLRWPVVVLGFVLLTFWGAWQAPTLAASLLLVLKAIGVILTGLLLSVQYGKTNDFTDSLCHLNQKTDCNHILTSSAAQITSWLGWSEVGFFYFMGGWIYLFNLTPAPLLSGEGFNILVILSFLALPYTFWSIWYQWRVAKQWCPLCVAVQVVIWAEVAIGSWEMMGKNTLQLLPTVDYRLWTSFVLPILLWLVIKPLLLKSKQADGWQRELRKFKNNPDIFNALLAKQKRMPPITADLQPIILGNPAAEHTITMVTNPYCGPCADAHERLEDVLAENPTLKAQIIFAVCHDPDGRKTKVAKHMMALNLSSLYSKGVGQNTVLDGVGAWYAQTTKNYEAWAAEYPADVSNIPDNIVSAHCEWTKVANIEGTPTFFIDGGKLPEIYGLKGVAHLLQYLTTDLAEST